MGLLRPILNEWVRLPVGPAGERPDKDTIAGLDNEPAAAVPQSWSTRARSESSTSAALPNTGDKLARPRDTEIISTTIGRTLAHFSQGDPVAGGAPGPPCVAARSLFNNSSVRCPDAAYRYPPEGKEHLRSLQLPGGLRRRPSPAGRSGARPSNTAD